MLETICTSLNKNKEHSTKVTVSFVLHMLRYKSEITSETFSAQKTLKACQHMKVNLKTHVSVAFHLESSASFFFQRDLTGAASTQRTLTPPDT